MALDKLVDGTSLPGTKADLRSYPASVSTSNYTTAAEFNNLVNIVDALKDRFTEAVNVKSYGATGDGTTNDLAAFQAAYAALPAGGGVILIPPPAVKYKIDGTGARIATPTIAMNITKANVFIVGVGQPWIHMSGWTIADSNADTDPSGRGDDVFTLFSFNNTTNGGVFGLRVLGDGDGATAKGLGKPRAKVVGFSDCTNMMARDLYGYRIVGNVVNARGTVAETTKFIQVLNCYAEGCNESGFNFMGGTADGTFTGNISKDNRYHGFESGCRRITVAGNIFSGNAQCGFSHVARNASVTGNVLTGNGTGVNFQYNTSSIDASYNVVSGNRIYSNTASGVYGEASTHHNVISGNHIANNGDGAGTGQGILLANGAARYTITANWIGNDDGGTVQRYGINFLKADTHNVVGNTIVQNAVYPVYVQVAGDGLNVKSNVMDGEINTVTGCTNLCLRDNAPGGDVLRTFSYPGAGGTTTIEAGRGEFWTINVSGNGAFTITATQAIQGAKLYVRVRRNTGGAGMGVITWDSAVFKMGTWVNPSADGQSRSIVFVYEGTRWVEYARTDADVPS